MTEIPSTLSAPPHALTPCVLWAKFLPGESGGIVSWHSLEHHSADVAAVLLGLLAQPTIAARMARMAGRPLDDVTVSRLGALAFLHDIGKANRGFRARVDPKVERIGHIDQVAWLFGTQANDLCGRLYEVAGLLMLADWLGSDSSDGFFPLANGTGPDRMAFAIERARHAIRTVGLDTASPELREAAGQVTFTEAFAVPKPRPVQKVAAMPNAACLVLEAETGSGKTEAALWRFAHLFARGAVDGLYFALPTRVAATAMFARVKTFRDRAFSGLAAPAVVLAVPGQVAVDDAEGRPLPNFGFEWDDAPPGTHSGARWAAEHPERFLAATIAVGTVDQALLGAVRARHAHLRGAALMRHLLVVDEVHASDRYMEDLLSTLLRNHLAAGGHALLLSATLGTAARARLLGTPCPAPDAAEAVRYPALSWNEAGAERRIVPPCDTDASPDKVVSVETAPLLDHPSAIGELALAAAEAGAKVLVIRNTVAAAVATAQALEAVAGPAHPVLFRAAGVATVHHGRFAPTDRRLLDAAVEAALGKQRAAGGRVVVGTQTLEISLDLDADLLLTDLCPAYETNADLHMDRFGGVFLAGRSQADAWNTPMSRYIGTMPLNAEPWPAGQSVSIGALPRTPVSTPMTAKVGVAARDRTLATTDAAAAPPSSRIASAAARAGWAPVMP